VYQNAKNTFEHFRQKFKLDQIWPSHITHIINCIHHMPTDIYSAAQSGLNFSKLIFQIELLLLFSKNQIMAMKNTSK
jgi:hypothetical protein